MTATEDNVAAQAGDEPMRLVSANLLDRAVALLQSSGQMGVAHQLKEGASPRATTAVAEALQVCVKALEFRKERSANDEFALNLARIALAEAPRATADVEREKLPHGHRDNFHLIANARALAMEPIHRIKSMPNWVLVKELFATGSTSAHEICAKARIDPDGYGVPRATTKPGA